MTSIVVLRKQNKICPNISIWGEFAILALKISRKRSMNFRFVWVWMPIATRHIFKKQSVIFCWAILRKVLTVWNCQFNWTPMTFQFINGLAIFSTKECHIVMFSKPTVRWKVKMIYKQQLWKANVYLELDQWMK